MNMTESKTDGWVEYLEEDDIAFVKRFLLCSGSLKDLAEAYGVSYPTVRLRLDRLIAKIKILEEHREEDEFERMLRLEFVEGRLEAGAFRKLFSKYQKQKEQI